MVAYQFQPIKEDRHREIATYVRLGNLSNKCKGFGICEVQVLPESEYQGQAIYKKVVCHISKVSERELVFSFFPNTMSSDQSAYYFDRPYFELEEDYVFTGPIANALQLVDFRIKRGRYNKYVIGSAHNLIFSSA